MSRILLSLSFAVAYGGVGFVLFGGYSLFMLRLSQVDSEDPLVTQARSKIGLFSFLYSKSN
jgi:hypothetical protein